MTDEDLTVAAAADEWTARYVLRRWQADRCALCGFTEGLVLDHDHETALIRGWLCRNCNSQEPHADDPRFASYREQSPAVMLGISARYHLPVLGWDKPSPSPPPLDRDPAWLVAAATSG